MKRITTLCLLSGFLGSLSAQEVYISPVPQSIEWSKEAFNKPSAMKLIGDSQADTDAVDLLKNNLEFWKKGLKLYIGERGDRTVKPFEKMIPQKKEGYYLKIDNDGIVVAGNDNAGTYYGVQTLLQIMKNDSFNCVSISDYPDVEERGVVEGFYGNPWSHKDRLRQFDFYGKNKMNVYIYGPKDDPYHREHWRDAYPADMADKIRELAAAAARNKVSFVWAMHPGNDIKWTEEDRKHSVEKLEKMYSLGVRSFAIFFDDIFGKEQSRAECQAEYMNYLQKEFVEKHDDVSPLIICPTEYNKGWAGKTYLPTLGDKLDKDIHIMWTGNTVVDMIDKVDMEWINGQIDRKAYIWLNYPVNDFCIDHLLMGPTYGNEKTIAPMVSGFVSNPMEYAEASKLSLYSIADYTWNMEQYDEYKSWEYALDYIMKNHKDAFKVFCEHNVDLGPNGHGLRRDGESASFRRLSEKFEGDNAYVYNAGLLAQIKAEFDKMVSSADELLSDKSEPELTAEITPWVKVMKYIGMRGQLVVQMYEDLESKDEKSFISNYEKQVSLEREQKNVLSRDFEGSIKKPNPSVASYAVSPFIGNSMKYLVRTYKQNHTYRTDIFPTEVLESGRYYIKCNGMWLTNENANADRVGDYPVWKEEADVINPQRQEWIVSVEPSGRYKIANAQDGRFITGNGTFRTSKEEKYDSRKHSFDILKADGKYAVKTSQEAGGYVVVPAKSRLGLKAVGKLESSLYMFEFIPTDSVVTK